MGVCPTIETDRLVLRPFRDDDLVDYFAMEDSPEVRSGLGTSEEFSKADAFVKMAAWLGQWELRARRFWYWRCLVLMNRRLIRLDCRHKM